MKCAIQSWLNREALRCEGLKRTACHNLRRYLNDVPYYTRISALEYFNKLLHSFKKDMRSAKSHSYRYRILKNQIGLLDEIIYKVYENEFKGD